MTWEPVLLALALATSLVIKNAFDRIALLEKRVAQLGECVAAHEAKKDAAG